MGNNRKNRLRHDFSNNEAFYPTKKKASKFSIPINESAGKSPKSIGITFF